MKKPKKETASIIVTYIQPGSGIVAKAAVDPELLQPTAVSIVGEPVFWCQRTQRCSIIYALHNGVNFSLNPPILEPAAAGILIDEIQTVADICNGLNSEIKKLKQ